MSDSETPRTDEASVFYRAGDGSFEYVLTPFARTLELARRRNIQRAWNYRKVRRTLACELSTLRTKLEEARGGDVETKCRACGVTQWVKRGGVSVLACCSCLIKEAQGERDQLIAKLADAEQDRDHYKTYEAGQGIFGDFGTAADMRTELNAVRGKLAEASANQDGWKIRYNDKLTEAKRLCEEAAKGCVSRGMEIQTLRAALTSSEAGAAAMRMSMQEAVKSGEGERWLHGRPSPAMICASALADSSAGKAYVERLAKAEAERDAAIKERQEYATRLQGVINERDGAIEGYEKLKQAHRDYIFSIREELGMVTPGDGFRETLLKHKSERDFAIAALTAAKRERDEAKKRICKTCNGWGEIGGPIGQTAESFDYHSEPCPDCNTSELSSLRAQLTNAITLIRAVRKGDHTFEFDRIDGLTWWDARDKVLKGEG